MSKKVYFRCNSGHYFDSAHCPFDDWTTGEFAEIAAVAGRLGDDVSIDRLQDQGIPAHALGRVLIIDFGSDASVFQAMDPAGYIVAGKWTPIGSAGADLR
jgi:hypothetical protein